MFLILHFSPASCYLFLACPSVLLSTLFSSSITTVRTHHEQIVSSFRFSVFLQQNRENDEGYGTTCVFRREMKLVFCQVWFAWRLCITRKSTNSPEFDPFSYEITVATNYFPDWNVPFLLGPSFVLFLVLSPESRRAWLTSRPLLDRRRTHYCVAMTTWCVALGWSGLLRVKLFELCVP
jgi:hypothetical protein